MGFLLMILRLDESILRLLLTVEIKVKRIRKKIVRLSHSSYSILIRYGRILSARGKSTKNIVSHHQSSFETESSLSAVSWV